MKNKNFQIGQTVYFWRLDYNKRLYFYYPQVISGIIRNITDKEIEVISGEWGLFLLKDYQIHLRKRDCLKDTKSKRKIESFIVKL